MTDLIDRQQVIELLEYEIELMRGHLDNVDFADHNARKGFETAIEILEDDVSSIKDTREFPSAQPEHKTGRWASFTEYLKHLEEVTGTKYDFYHQKYHDDFVFCSRCWQMKNRYENWNYCPNCGSCNGGGA